MKINTITNDVVKLPESVNELFKDLINHMKTTKYDRTTFSFTDPSSKTGIIINQNEEWVQKYINDKLYLDDPVCKWEDKAVLDLSTRKTNKVYKNDFESIHNSPCIDGEKLKKIRNDFLIYSGGTTVTKHNDVILTLDWWSSDKNAKFLNDYNCPLKRLFFLEIEKNLIDIYNKNYNLIFKDKKLINENVIIDI
ncbi:hypothetical protein [Silvanigrella sp.]|jgi:hypothetical protein|uniref:hypothetical protein n=1 Tax=Silvanigrella sp. TaxID=2024976 RepID=UPI0037C96B4E